MITEASSHPESSLAKTPGTGVGRSSVRHGPGYPLWSVEAEMLRAQASARERRLQQLRRQGTASQPRLRAAYQDEQGKNRWRQADGGAPGNTENISQHHRQ